MLNKTLKFVLIGGKAAALSVLLGTTAMAQDATVVHTPGQDAVIPDAAKESGAPMGTVVDDGFPRLEQMENDQAIAETLIAQGFTDIQIMRDGSLMTVNAIRDGQPIELVYNLVEGRLIYVNGERILTDEEKQTSESSGDTSKADTAGSAILDAAEESNAEASDSSDGSADTDASGEASAETGAEGSMDAATDGATDGMTDSATDGTGTDATTEGTTSTEAGASSETDAAGSDTDAGAESSTDAGSETDSSTDGSDASSDTDSSTNG